MDVQLTKNFKLSEFLVTSKKYPIKNECLTLDVLHNIYSLAHFLQFIRNYTKSPLVITSGFRPDKLNTLVKGAKNSYHLVGAAADISVPVQHYDRIFDFISECTKSDIFHIAELLGSKSKSWFHISIDCKQRKYKRIVKKNYYE